mgnify:CR=1 FL=1
MVALSRTSVSVGSPSRTLVADLDLSIGEGERWAILGANGCGKSTLAALLGDRLRLDEADGAEADGAEAFESISFDSHQRLLQAEAKEFQESRFESRHMRATVASYLFPHLYPEDPEANSAVTVGYRPARTRLATLPLRYDVPRDSPLLAELEAAVSEGEVAAMLHALGLFDQRHSPMYGLSTGEGRKLMLIKALLRPPRLLVLDEAFDGLEYTPAATPPLVCPRHSRQRAETRAPLSGSVQSRTMLRDVLADVYASADVRPASALALVAHRRDDLLLPPTHALLLGQGADCTGYLAGAWQEMKPKVDAYFAAHQSAAAAVSPLAVRRSAPKRVLRAGEKVRRGAVGDGGVGSAVGSAEGRPPIVELRDVSVRYPMKTVFEGLCWEVRQGEKWVVAGGNGSGKSTLLELITGENLQGYQNDVRLFGRQKGDGVSVWEIKEKLGVVSTKFHMSYADYADPTHKRADLSTWAVVCSGFFDSIGLYKKVSIEQERVARQWVHRFALTDLVTPPALGVRRVDRLSGKVVYDRPAVSAPQQSFHQLSFGEQKLVLLCRAMVKQPPLLLLDEPTHGLSGGNRDRLLGMLSCLTDDPEVTVVYISHHQDEIESLDFENVLQL